MSSKHVSHQAGAPLHFEIHPSARIGTPPRKRPIITRRFLWPETDGVRNRYLVAIRSHDRGEERAALPVLQEDSLLPAGSPDAVDVRLDVLGHVVVHHRVHVLDVQPPARVPTGSVFCDDAPA